MLKISSAFAEPTSQRLKGAIDSRIAEEQARQRSSQASPSRPSPANRRPATRDESPSKRPERTGARGRKDGDPSRKSPDPAEFEPEFVIGDDDMPSRSGTPRPVEPKRRISSSGSGPDSNQDATNGPAQENSANKDSAAVELPTDVRVKLRKLDKLESKYHGGFISQEKHTFSLILHRVATVISRCPCPGSNNRAIRDCT